MPSHLSLEKDSEANAAASEAARGAVFGASKWGIATAALGALAYAGSPLYRGLTLQFKVFIQMSGLTLGGMIEADRRLRGYEGVMRPRKRVERDQLVWRKWEGLVEAEPRGEPRGAASPRGSSEPASGARMERRAEGMSDGEGVDVVGKVVAGEK